MIIDTNAILSKVKAIFKSNDDGLALFPNATEAICASLADLNCTYNVERNDQNKDKVIYFKYQGMNFRAFTFSADDNDNCNLDYHAGVYRFEDLEYLRQVTNNANSSVSPIHFYFIADTKDNFYNLYATATLTNVTEI
ncbi:MAG: hypothetical protein HUK07_07680, partial [Bacteroidaceae bacterium]|nr:hypothetical protein [Bacteroidaceae bacterium]